MLVLVAGATGNLGLHIIDALSARGHKVRGLGRTPSKLDGARKAKLDGFVTSQSYYDIPALEEAVDGVDAVICAYQGLPELHLDAQLLLLRAAERAGVQKDLKLGMHQSYDPQICFRQQVQLTSTIKPIYIFTGAFAEVFFSLPGHGNFSPANNGPWDPAAKTLDVWGTGNEKWNLTTEQDAAAVTAALVSREDAAQGGFWSFNSGEYSANDIARIYKEVRGKEVTLKMRGSVDELEQAALTARSQRPYRDYFSYIGLFYQLYQINGAYALRNVQNESIGIKGTALEEFLRANPRV
ncbi:hypothetical protein LCI18_005639 [Fusarium solani-melongenae]|uniref:Uncharacterized protein n=1 Tax=Fusarium solani subsp. cucurbitae TaxID=2747967 RepID=A0ACD3Z0D8_FUSSC|nr:hypothetical protein LCI18_005639 [Fusarium solani-melongenae]